MRLLGEDITVLAGHGFDEKGPYLLINDISKAAKLFQREEITGLEEE